MNFGLMLGGAWVFGVAGIILAPALAFLFTYPVLLSVIDPYRGWDLRHDALYLRLAFLIAPGAIWYNFVVIAALFQEA